MTAQHPDNDPRLRRYKIPADPIGEGGMGAVFRAKDLLHNKPVALKRILVTSADYDNYVRAALAQEFRVLASIRHPHIIAVDEFGFDSNKQPFFTMEFLDNAQTIKEAGENLSIFERLDLIIQLLQSLTYLSRRRIIHRDLKPDNVLVDNSGKVRVLDFGLAIEEDDLTDPEIAGTIMYIAPEVLSGDDITTVSDLYAVGVIAYEILTGMYPYDMTTTNMLIFDILQKYPDYDFLQSQISSAFETARTGETIRVELPKTSPSGNAPDVKETQETEASQVLNTAKTLPDSDTVFHQADVTGEITNAAQSHHADEFMDTTVGDPRLQTTHTDIVKRKKIARPKRISPQKIQDVLTHLNNADNHEQELAEIVQKLLQKDPDARYQDPFVVIQDIYSALGQEIPDEQETIRDSLLEAATFVGREKELQQLKSALNKALEGKGSNWLLAGESGAGKSRTLEELSIEALIHGAIVLRIQANRESRQPYHMWTVVIKNLAIMNKPSDVDITVLLSIVPDLNELLDTDLVPAENLSASAGRERLHQTILRLFQNVKLPMLLLLEDLQWAEDSMDLIQEIGSITSEYPMMVVGSYRDDEQVDIGETLPAWQKIKLERLHQDEIKSLSQSILGEAGQDKELIAFLERETEGNVFFIVDTLRALASQSKQLLKVMDSDLPDTIRAQGITALLDQQLAYVPQEFAGMTSIIAIIGRELEPPVLRYFMPSSMIGSWIEHSANIALIDKRDGIWQFRHDKLRERWLDYIEADEKVVLHRQVARAIESTFADPDIQSERLAYHYGAAGNVEQELHYSIIAADQRYLIGDAYTAQKYANAAFQLIDDDREDLIKLNKLLGDIHHSLGNLDLSQDHYEETLRLARQYQDEHMTATALNRLGRNQVARHEPDTAIKLLNEALAIATSQDDTFNQGEALLHTGNVLSLKHDYTQAMAKYVDAATLFEKAGSRRWVGVSKLNQGSAAGELDDLISAAQLFEEAAGIATALSDRRELIKINRLQGVVAEMLGDLETAGKYYKSALDNAREMRHPYIIMQSLHSLGRLLFKQRRWDEARAYFDESMSKAEETDHKYQFNEIESMLLLGYINYHKDNNTIAMDYLLEASNRDGAEHHANRICLGLLVGLASGDESDHKLGASIVGYLDHRKPEFEFGGLSLQIMFDHYGNLLAEDVLTQCLEQGKQWSWDDVKEVANQHFK